ncbi:unnamed protein product [Larinioides sclopetarius]|uniref:Uncharacterized protein n=1 Tax=Larinioides sclopetarius TaxID=280406 RepID=A0AAV1ZSD5_9ARAC
MNEFFSEKRRVLILCLKKSKNKYFSYYRNQLEKKNACPANPTGALSVIHGQILDVKILSTGHHLQASYQRLNSATDAASR